MNEEKPKCTRGHEHRCAHAQCEQCHCACGGENHGKERHNAPSVGERAVSEQDIEAARHSVEVGAPFKVCGFYPSRRVFIGEKELSPAPSQKLYNHSPDGFNWGYGGSGTAQLALAILLELVGEERAMRAYQELKWKKLATLEQGKNFEMPVSEITNWLNEYEKQK